jgi:mono/diheme cytochrome c family protein
MAKPVSLLTSAILILSAAIAVAACGGAAPATPTAAPAKPAATTAPTVAQAPTTAPTVALAPTTAPTTAAVAPTTAAAPTTAVAPATTPAATTAATPAGTPEAETAGLELYEVNCAACHGPDGAGGLKIGSATSADIRSGRLATAYKNDDTLISRAILNGQDEQGKDLDPAMPRFQGKLTAPQVSQIIAYLKTLK